VLIQSESFDFEAFFQSHYERIARAVARVVGDQARAEELAVDAFWKLWQTPRAQDGNAGGWLYRTAVRLGLNELRGRERRLRHKQSSAPPDPALTPEQIHAAAEQARRVRSVLAALDERQSELLLLRASDLSYEEIGAAVGVSSTSVGTLIARAQKAFRKEYEKRYGTE